jgi:trimethylamine--corrinoid protein Co-methyltransferase
MKQQINSGFKSRCVPQYRLLTLDQIRELHLATLEILETVGVKVMHEEAVRLLSDAGCRLKKDGIVQFPNWIVEECIQSAPSRVTVYNRKGEESMHLEGNKVYFGLGTDLLNTYDLQTGALRKSCLQDVVDAAVVADFCKDIDFIASYGFAGEVPTNLSYIAAFKALLENSTKPIYFTAAAGQDLSIIIEMATAVAGGEEPLKEKPFLIHYAEPLSPLVHSCGAIEKLFLSADKGIPLNYVPALLSGGTGPVTLAGAMAVANAEALSGLVIQQLRSKGAPMISGFSVTPLDMLYGTTVYGSPEERLTHTACTDLYHYYGLPVWGEAGCSDSKSLDEQAAIESTVSILMAALDGTNLVHNIGYLGQGLIGSTASIVMCSEIISYVKRIMRGFDMRREQIAVNSIRKVGPGGHFLAEEQTAQFFKQEHWRPRFIDRQNLETWQEKGSKRYSQIVTQKAIDILKNHKPDPLPSEVINSLDKILKKAETELGDKSFSV